MLRFVTRVRGVYEGGFVTRVRGDYEGGWKGVCDEG